MKKSYEVSIGYPSEYFNAPDDKFAKLADKHNGAFSGSGCGFGQRDLHFVFETKKSAQEFIKACKGAKFKFKVKFKIDSVNDS